MKTKLNFIDWIRIVLIITLIINVYCMHGFSVALAVLLGALIGLALGIKLQQINQTKI